MLIEEDLTEANLRIMGLKYILLAYADEIEYVDLLKLLNISDRDVFYSAEEINNIRRHFKILNKLSKDML